MTGKWKGMTFKANRISKVGWVWVVDFNAYEEWSSSPSFSHSTRRREMILRLDPLVEDKDFAFIDNANLMFRSEDDAMLCYLRYS